MEQLGGKAYRIIRVSKRRQSRQRDHEKRGMRDRDLDVDDRELTKLSSRVADHGRSSVECLGDTAIL